MKTVRIGKSSLTSSRLAYGCWRLAGTNDPHQLTPERESHGRAAVLAAHEAGYTLFDHADIYCDGTGERIFGQVLRDVPGLREQIVLASKCGIRMAGQPEATAPYRYDFSADYIISSCEGSLQRLGVETIDLYQLHRPDFLGRPDEVAGAFSRLLEAGKVREFGVSNFRPSQWAALQRACPMPLVANQIELSLCHLDAFQDGTLDQCLAEGVTPVAWGPLGGGRLARVAAVDLQDPHHAHKLKLSDALEAVARERGVSRSVVALAWLLRHPSGIVPIVGSTQPDRIRDCAQADALELTREEWYRLHEAAYGQRLP
ncbi:MAG: aldo/keto reductase [Verrucomicrobia bacterium]|nr:aldo/keto reductase [Verrucomicrobiota bacterium]